MSIDLSNSLKKLQDEVPWHILVPPENITVWEWADKNRIISQGNAEPGPWRTTRAPYQKGLMEAITDPSVYKVTAMMGAQTGKTDSLILNSIGFYIDNDPSNLIVMQPTETDMQTFQTTKLDPMIRDTPSLKSKVAKPRARVGVNNTKVKSFPGGFIFFSHSGSPNTMRGRSAGKVFMDEVDGYELTPEGHPCFLLEKRAKTFADKKIIITSTPTSETKSFVNKSFEQGDRRRFWIPCPNCNEMQVLAFQYIKWDKDDEGNGISTTARYECPECNHHISDGEKIKALALGEWRAEKHFHGHASFHLSSLYSPFVTWKDIAQDFFDALAQGDIGSFINTVLAEVTKDISESVDFHRLYERRETYSLNTIPMGGLFLTAAADVQADRIECEIRAWGRNQESWSVDYRVFPGDTSNPESICFKQLDELLDETWPHDSGTELMIKRFAIDCGYQTPTITKWARKYKSTGVVMCVKGTDKGAQIVNQTRETDMNHRGKKIKHGVKIWMVGTDVAKSELFKRLALNMPEDGKKAQYGFIHFPMYDMNYFKMLTAEKLVKRTNRRGYEEEEWTKIRHRNEALDIAVYNRAAAYAYGIDRFNERRWRELEQIACVGVPVEDLEEHNKNFKRNKPGKKSNFWSK